jgi:outer membrane protein TolC
MALALAANPDLAAAAAAEAEARARQTMAAAGWFPRLSVHEAWQRGNQPVFVFGSLLGQRRFGEANFALASLNRPDPLNNFRVALSVAQPVFDGGAASAASAAAVSAASLASVARRAAAGDVAVAVVQTYSQALVADAMVRSTAAAIETAAADVERSRARRDAGLVTDADVLSLEVYLAQMRAGHIAASGDAQIARVTLNRLIGAALDRAWDLSEPPDVAAASPSVDPADAKGVEGRPDVAAAGLRVDAARAHAQAARAALWPRVQIEGGYEWNGGSWGRRAGSWIVGISAQLSVSLRGAERAGVDAAGHAADRARAEQASVDSAAHVDLRTARARLDTARAKLAIARAAVSQARESERIIRDRYEAGLTSVTDLLRAAHAVLDAQALDIGARADAIAAAVMLERAVGQTPALSP